MSKSKDILSNETNIQPLQEGDLEKESQIKCESQKCIVEPHREKKYGKGWYEEPMNNDLRAIKPPSSSPFPSQKSKNPS